MAVSFDSCDVLKSIISSLSFGGPWWHHLHFFKAVDRKKFKARKSLRSQMSVPGRATNVRFQDCPSHEEKMTASLTLMENAVVVAY